MKSIGFYIGFLDGYIKGWQEGRRFVKLVKKYGSLDKIPTREIRTLGRQSEMMVRRQAVTIAMYKLTAAVKMLNGHEIPNTENIISAWLNFSFHDSDKIVDSISRSESIIHSLADIAAHIDSLDLAILENNFKERKISYIWEQYRSNDCLTVI